MLRVFSVGSSALASSSSFLYLLVGVGLTIIAGWNAALTGWTVADPTLPLTIAGGALIFMLLAWTIPNTAASVVGGAVSLNLSHAFEAAMAGYGLGRILTSQNAAGAESSSAHGGHSLGASLEAGDKAAANNGARVGVNPSDGPDALKPPRVGFVQSKWKPNGGCRSRFGYSTA